MARPAFPRIQTPRQAVAALAVAVSEAQAEAQLHPEGSGQRVRADRLVERINDELSTWTNIDAAEGTDAPTDEPGVVDHERSAKDIAQAVRARRS